MIEKIKNWKIVVGKNKKIFIQTHIGIVHGYTADINYKPFTKKDMCGWNIYSVLRTHFNELKVVSIYRMKDGAYVKLNKGKIKEIVYESINNFTR